MSGCSVARVSPIIKVFGTVLNSSIEIRLDRAPRVEKATESTASIESEGPLTPRTSTPVDASGHKAKYGVWQANEEYRNAINEIGHLDTRDQIAWIVKELVALRIPVEEHDKTMRDLRRQN